MIPRWLVGALAAVLAGGSLYYTIRAYGGPLVWPKRWGSLLPVLRLLSTLVLLVSVFNPEITVPWWRTEEASVVVLDASLSMAIQDSIGRSRLVRATRFLPRAHKAILVDDEHVRRVSTDSTGALVLTGRSTDIGSMLSRAVGATAAERIIFVSDGSHNTGSNPLPVIRRLNTPISCIPANGVGEPVDLSIHSVREPSLLLPGQTVSIPVQVHHRGATTAVQTSVRLLVDDAKVDEESVLVAPGASADVTLMYTPTAVGRSEARIVVEPVRGEQETSNNTRYLSIEVRKSRWITELFFTKPSWDLSFLHQSLNEDGGFDTRITVPTLTMHGDDTTEDHVDLIILGLYGGHEPSSWRQKAGDVLERGGGVVCLGWPASGVWGDISPLTCMHGGAEEERLHPTDHSELHPLIRDILRSDHAVPPVTFPMGEVSLSSRATVLLRTSDDRPALAVQPSDNGYVMAWLGADWWRWLLSDGVRFEQDSRTFWPRALRWLLTPGTRGRLRVHTETGNLAVGTGRTVGIEVFSRGWEPAKSGVVSLMLTRLEGTDTTRTRALISDGTGTVSFRLPGLGPGHWELSASAVLPEGDSLYTRHHLLIPPTTAEMIFTEPNESLLARIARETGGTVCLPDEHSRLDSLLAVADHVYAPKRIRCLRTPFPFVILLLLLAAEWWLRQRRGLP